MSTRIKVNAFFPFCRVKITDQRVNNQLDQVLIKIEPNQRYLPVCSNCQQKVRLIHSYNVRLVRDIPIMQAKTVLKVYYRKVRCPICGNRVEDLGFVKHGERLTERFKRFIADLCQIMTIKDVADWLDLNWKTVKQIHKQYLKEQVGNLDLQGVRILAVDEISIRKGHKYLTIVIDFETGRILWTNKDRKTKSLGEFFSLLSEEEKKRIQAVAMDMWDPYIKAVKEYLPNARIVFDQFHVVKEYSKVIDSIRISEFKAADKEHQKYFKGTKYLLLKNQENLREKDKQPLEKLLSINRNLSISYILKDSLKQLWGYCCQDNVRRRLLEWVDLAIDSGIKQLIKFAKKLLRYGYGIINHAIYPIHNSKLEGINNKIKTVKRKAYGFSDMEYFELLLKKITT